MVTTKVLQWTSWCYLKTSPVRAAPLMNRTVQKKKCVKNKDILEWIFLPSVRAKSQIGVSNFHPLHFSRFIENVSRPRDAAEPNRSDANAWESVVIFCICNPPLTKIIKKTQRKHCYRNTNMKSAVTLNFKATALNRERQIHLKAVRSSKVFHIWNRRQNFGWTPPILQPTAVWRNSKCF